MPETLPLPPLQLEKAVFTAAEFASHFGHHKSWAYRLIYSHKIKVIHQFGKMMVPATEIEKILGSVDHYLGS